MNRTSTEKQSEKPAMEGSLVRQAKSREYYDGGRDDMLKYIPQTAKRTLEFGCGFGEFSALLKRRLDAESWAVEVDETAAREASQRLDKVICADAHASLTHLPDDHFDCIVLFDILEHLVDPYSLLLAVQPKLTPHGVVVASIPNIRFYRTFLKFVLHGEWQYEEHGIMDSTHLRFFTRKSIIDLFEGRGYRIVTLEGIHPTTSRTYKLLNALLLNTFADVRYRQFAVVAAPCSGSRQ
ncbi:MAG: class I SAM-dependent methyltransferase [Sedimentisphaerales bacterium]|nr:class I SAM-dependent methyltransferase [Sedimentisphaerales bacterium]